MTSRRARVLVAATALAAVLGGCSSSGSAPSAPADAPGGAAGTPAADPAQTYVDAVNALCDALLPEVVAVTHGGSIDVPAREYVATWPAHKRLRDGFDAHLADITVPDAAADQAAALSAYVRFADRLDARRLAAARSGQSAYAEEVRSESGAENDPAIAALAAAGFNDSCTAR